MQMKRLALFYGVTFAVLAILTLSGCGDSNPTNSFEPRVTNEVDSFSFWATNVYVVTTRLTYSWTNTGASASIYHASARSRGTGTLMLLDANGGQVYQSNLQSNVTEAAAAGVPGSWTIVLVLEEFSGTINFRVSKL